MHDDVYDVWPQREGTGETSHAKPNYDAVELILPPTDRSIDRMMTQNPSLGRNERRRRQLSEGRAARLLICTSSMRGSGFKVLDRKEKSRQSLEFEGKWFDSTRQNLWR